VNHPKWLVIAKNEYRIRTSRIRKIRAYFPFIAGGFIAIFTLLLAPAFVELFIDDFLSLLFSQIAVTMMQVLLFLVFVYLIMIPISDTLREEQTRHLEVFLAAPLNPSDVLFGEFIGELPFYVIIIAVIAGAFSALFRSLQLHVLQFGIIIVVFILISLSALWIGTLIAALLRTQLGESTRGKDIGRALAMIIALPMVALIYAIQFGGVFEALADPVTGGVIHSLLNILPSSWGAEIIVWLATHPGNLELITIDVGGKLLGLGLFLIGVFGLGKRVATRAYSLEPTTFISSIAKPDGRFYKAVKQISGKGAFGTLVTSVFKDYSRRLENLSNIAYMVGLLFLMNVFIVPNYRADDPPIALMMSLFIFPILVVMVVGGVTVQGKESLFLFKKAPHGVERLIKARLVQSWLTIIPIVGVVTAATMLLSLQNASLLTSFANTGLLMFIIAAYVVFVLGLFLLNPAFSTKSVRLFINILIVEFVSIGLFAIPLILLTLDGRITEPMEDLTYSLLIQALLSWLLGIGFLFLGKRKLEHIE
jgi:hypothetical protein